MASGILGEPVEDLKIVPWGIIKGKRGEITLAKTLDVTHREIGIAVHAHPTLAEAVMEAALDIDGAAIHQ